MSYERRQHAGGAIDTTLNGDISSGATSLALSASTNWPDGSVGPFVLIIDPGLSTEEKMLATSRTTTTLSGLTRGYDGTSAAAHSSGATIKHCFAAVEADEANALVKATLGSVAAKGDLLAGTAANTIGKLAVGADNTVLVANASQTTGLSWTTLTSASLAANAVGTSQIASQAVTSAKIATAAVDGSTITGGNGTALSVPTGGISTTQLAANAVTTAKITDANVTTAKLVDASVTAAKLASASVVLGSFASSVRPVTICTSSTRPGSPSIGDRIFETDTGHELTYQSVATGWTPPWNTAWGELVYKEQTTNVVISTLATVTNMDTGTFSVVANRVLRIETSEVNITPSAAGLAKVYITDGTPSVIRTVVDVDTSAGKRFSGGGDDRVVTTAGSLQYKIRAETSSGTLTFGAAARPADPGPIWMRVVDEGPSGAPA